MINAYEASRLRLAQRIVAHMDRAIHHYVAGFLAVVVIAAASAVVIVRTQPAHATATTKCIVVPFANRTAIKEL